MLKIYIIIASIFFIGCSNKEVIVNHIHYPQWYKVQKFTSKNEYEIIEYGYGRTIKEAKSNAKENISLEISSLVDSEYRSVSTNEYRHSKSRLSVTSKLNLQNLKTLKQEHQANRYFVALMYKNIDIAHRIKKALNFQKCVNEDVNLYMSKTLLHKKITSALRCKLDLKIDRRNDAWYLRYKELLFPLKNDEFEELFTSNKNKKISLLPSKNTLVEGDFFFLEVKSREAGYITLFKRA